MDKMDDCFLYDIDLFSENNESDESDMKRLMTAAKSSTAELIDDLFNEGIDLNTKTKRGYTALHYAAMRGSVTVVIYLCEKGVHINATTDENKTALHFAARNFYPEIVTYLCENGADVDIKTKNGWTPLHISTNEKNLYVVRMICERTKAINDKTIKGMTAMHMAVKNKRPRIIEALYKKGASLFIKDNKGRTAFDYALDATNSETVQIFYNLGVDLNQKTLNGTTALHKAINRRFLLTAQFLLDKNVKTDIKDDRGLTALDYAIKRSFGILAQFIHEDMAIDRYSHNQYLKFNTYSKIYEFLSRPRTQINETDKKRKKSTILMKLKELFYFYDITFGNVNYGNKPSIDTIINSNIHGKFLCKFDVYNPHVLLCTATLSTGHEVCLRCVLKLKCDNDNVVCFTDLCYERWFNDDFPLHGLLACPKQSVIKRLVNDDLVSLTKNCIYTLNESVVYMNEQKDEINNELVSAYFDRLMFPEDLIDIRIECLTIELDKMFTKLSKKINKMQRILKYNSEKIYSIEIITKIIRLSWKKEKKIKEAKMVDIGIFKVQPLFVNLEPDIWKSIKQLERAICFNLVDRSNEISEEIEEMNKIRSINEDVHDIQFLMQAENIINDVGQTLKDYNKFENLFESKKDIRKSINEMLNFDIDQNTFNSASYKKAIEQLRHSNDKIKSLNDLFLVRSPNENELKAFQIVRNGTIDEFRKVYDEDPTTRINVIHRCSTLLIDAVYNENIEIVKYLIEKGADMNILDSCGRTLVQVAALTNSSNQVIEYLISKECAFGSESLKAVLLDDFEAVKNIHVNHQDNFGATILHYIGARGKIQLLSAVMNLDEANKNLVDNKQLTCFERAGCIGSVESVKGLLEQFKIELKMSERIVQDVCYKVLLYGQNIDVLKWLFENVEELKQNTADLSVLTSWLGGKAPQLINEKIDVLLSKGAKLSQLDRNDYNIMMVVADEFYYNPLTEEFLNKMITNGLNVEQISSNQQNIYHIAAKYGNLELIELVAPHLLSSNLNTRDSFGYTPLMYAIENGHISTVKRILPFNKVNNIDDDLTILDLALANGYEEICKLLKENGIESNVSKYFRLVVKVSQIDVSDAGDEPLYMNSHNLCKISNKIVNKSHKPEKLIIKCFKYCSLKLLLEYKIPFEKYVDDYGGTALHISAAFARNDLILWLIKNDFPLESIDKAGFYALEYAALNRHLSTVMLFNMLGLKNMYRNGMKPFVNIFKFVKSKDSKYSLNMLLEELHISVETIKGASKLLTEEELNNLNKLLTEYLAQ